MFNHNKLEIMGEFLELHSLTYCAHSFESHDLKHSNPFCELQKFLDPMTHTTGLVQTNIQLVMYLTGEKSTFQGLSGSMCKEGWLHCVQLRKLKHSKHLVLKCFQN